MSLFRTLVTKDDKAIGQSTGTSSWKQKLQSASGKQGIGEQPKRTLYLLLDCSGSMDEGGKMQAAKRGAVAFCGDAATKGYAVGVIAFSNEAVCLRDATASAESIADLLYGIPASGSTDMAGALLMAVRKLRSRGGTRVVCLVTDGIPDDKASAFKAAHSLAVAGVDIMTLGTDDADKDFLDRVATTPGSSIKVPRQELQQGIKNMALLLPG